MPVRSRDGKRVLATLNYFRQNQTVCVWLQPDCTSNYLSEIHWGLLVVICCLPASGGRDAAFLVFGAEVWVMVRNTAVPLGAHSTENTAAVQVQSLSRVQLFATPWTAAHQASLSFTISRSLLSLMPIESVMPSNCLILCRPLLLPPSVFPSVRACCCCC